MGWVAGTPANDPAANAELARLSPNDGVQVSVQILITFRGPAGFDAIMEHIDEYGAIVAAHLLPVGLNPFILPYIGPINLGKKRRLGTVKNDGEKVTIPKDTQKTIYNYPPSG